MKKIAAPFHRWQILAMILAHPREPPKGTYPVDDDIKPSQESGYEAPVPSPTSSEVLR